MALCLECLPECEHDYCDSCSKCHLCGVFANAPASPVPSPRSPVGHYSWLNRRPIAPSLFENDYDRFAVALNNTVAQAAQLH